MRCLKNLSDNDLLNRLVKLVKQEHDLTLEILLHIIEVEDRRIYRSLGYRSMFIYCTEGLGYSESSANRRICAARAIRKCPIAYDYLCDGQVNLSNLATAWKYVTPELLEKIAGKSQKQVFAIIARFEPKMKYRDSTRPVVVMQRVECPDEDRSAGASSNGSGGPALAAPTSSKAKLGEIHLRCGGKKSSSDEISTPPKTETVRMHQVSCLLDDKLMQKLDRYKELLSGKYPCGIDYNTLLSELATAWLEKNDPIARAKRREQRKKSRVPRRADQKKPSRHISPGVRDAVCKRDGGRCTYVGADGKRCNSKWDLEVHHAEVPFAKGGSHSVDNLKLLCSAHNKLEAERVFGKNHMENPIGKNSQTTVRESNVLYLIFTNLIPDRAAGDLASSGTSCAYGFS